MNLLYREKDTRPCKVVPALKTASTGSNFSLIKYILLFPFSLALLSDDDMEMRQWAVEKIIQIRQKVDMEEVRVRVWRKPTLKFEPFPKHYR